MPVTEQIWKYSWNSIGYPLETFQLDTSKNLVGDFVYLPHSLFRDKGFLAYLLSTSKLQLVVSLETDAKKGDIVLSNEDPALTAICNTKIFRRIQLNSSKAIGLLEIRCQFAGDIIDSNDFGQTLNKEADVIHKSITTESGYIKQLDSDSIVTQGIEGDWGVLMKDKALLLGMEITKDSLIFKEGVKIKAGNSVLQYDPKDRRWELFDVYSNQSLPIITSLEPAVAIPPYCIPIATEKNLTALSFLPWLNVDPVTQTLNVPRIKIGQIDFSPEGILVKDFGLRVLGTVLDINGVIQLDKATNVMTICGKNFHEILNEITSLTNKVKALEDEILSLKENK